MEEEIKQSEMWDLECERCYYLTDLLFKHYKAKDGMTCYYEDSGMPIPEEEREEIWLCRDCDWEVTNGVGGMDDDASEIGLDREQRDYEMDPVNNDPPWIGK